MTLNICSDLQTRELRWIDNSKNAKAYPALPSYIVAGNYRMCEPIPHPIVIK